MTEAATYTRLKQTRGVEAKWFFRADVSVHLRRSSELCQVIRADTATLQSVDYNACAVIDSERSTTLVLNVIHHVDFLGPCKAPPTPSWLTLP